MRKPRKPNRNDVVKVENTTTTDNPLVAPDVTAQKDPVKKQVRKTDSVLTAKVQKNPASPKPQSRPKVEEIKTSSPASIGKSENLSLPANQTDREVICQATLKQHTIAAGAISLMPIPGADIIGLTGVQANLIEELSQAYGYIPTPGWALRLAGLFVLSVGFVDAGKLVLSSVCKLLPGVGSLVGAGGMAAYSAATTYALGKSIVTFYEGGGTPERLVTSSLIASTKASLAEGKAFWQRHCPCASKHS